MNTIRALLFLAFIVVTPVLAHAEFEGSDPADGAVLELSPLSVTLSFTEAVDTKFSVFKVYKLDDPELIAELSQDHADDNHHAADDAEADHHDNKADDNHADDDHHDRGE